jgi:hypothetical protein
LVGAGLSKSGVRSNGEGLSDWHTLMKNMIEDLRDSNTCDASVLTQLDKWLKEGKFLEIAREFKVRTRPDQFAAFLTNELDPTDVCKSELHQIILKIGFRGIITTNFDMVFESQGFSLRTLVYPQFLDSPATIRYDNFFLKMHGCIRNTPNLSENLILTEESYTALRQNKKYQIILHSLLLTHPLITVGFSLKDPDFLALIDDLRLVFGDNFPTIYALVSDLGHNLRDEWRSKGIEIVPYENHNELLHFFKQLLEMADSKREKENVSNPNNLVVNYSQKIVSCFHDCNSKCYGQYPWCRAASEFALTMDNYVVQRVKISQDCKGISYQRFDCVIDEWLSQTDKTQLAILGDSGLGKTSVCAFLTLQIAQTALKESPSSLYVIPIFLSLEYLARKQLLGESIYNIVNKTLPNMGWTNTFVEGMVKKQGFLFILDGFDEISDRADHAKILRNLDDLKPFFSSGCKTVLTCRTHFFADQEQVEKVLTKTPDVGTELYAALRTPEFQIIELQKFSIPEIKKVIRVREPANYREVWEKIKSIYNLADLSRRPLLLSLILSTLPRLMAKNTEINRAHIYDEYTGFWFRREAQRVETTVDVKKKEQFIEELALQMWKLNVVSISFNELQETIRRNYQAEIASIGDFYIRDYDIRNASFLNRENDGSYKFMHKSFMEYFVARKLVSSLNKNKKNMGCWNLRWFDKEVASFMSDLIQQKKNASKIRILANLCLNKEINTTLWNVLHILSLVETANFKRYAGSTLLDKIIARAENECDAVILRQYCRIIAKFGSKVKAKELLRVVIEITKNYPEQNEENNKTYITYYYGKSSACEALLKHLSTRAPDYYDRELHIHVLGEIGELRHAEKLKKICKFWKESHDLDLVQEAIEKIQQRK